MYADCTYTHIYKQAYTHKVLLVLPTRAEVWCHPLKHGKATEFSNKNDAFPPQLSTANGLAIGAGPGNHFTAYVRILAALILYRAYVGNHSCCEHIISVRQHLQRSFLPSELSFFLPSLLPHSLSLGIWGWGWTLCISAL